MCLVPRDSHVERDAPRDVVTLTCALFYGTHVRFSKSLNLSRNPLKFLLVLEKKQRVPKRMNLYPLFSFLIAKKIVFDKIISACETD